MKAFLALLFAASSALSQWQSIGNVTGYEKTVNGIIVSAPPTKVILSVLGADVVRIRASKDGAFLPDSSWAVITHSIKQAKFQVDENEKFLLLTLEAGFVRIQKSPCRISFYTSQGNLINSDDSLRGMSWSGDENIVWKAMPPDEHYFGLGEKASSTMDRRGKMFTNWNTDIPAYKADTDPLYETLPFFYGVHKGTAYGIFYDNTYYSHFDMGKEDQGAYSFGATGGEMNYYFFFGPEPATIMRNLASLTGSMPLPPRWALGYQQCRWSYYPESRVREIASTFRSKKIPCDVIYLDIHYM
ncbi:MAG TPA: TIM-barrel domain-containing protein, partial [Bacteroidota bacterium]|nr:TIM-barrel domain-containing protein [Bacteroidota bacterium]